MGRKKRYKWKEYTKLLLCDANYNRKNNDSTKALRPHRFQVYTCQVLCLRRDCHALGSKTLMSHLLTPVLQFLTPGRSVRTIRVLTDTFLKYVDYRYFIKETDHETSDRKQKSMWMIKFLWILFYF